ncbi:MAG: hypothetical protein V3S00_06030 [Dehalococcoidia bacterium]
MNTLSDYGGRFRAAFAALHGGDPDDEDGGPGQSAEPGPGEPLTEFLSRSRSQTLGLSQRQLADGEPPPPLLREAHDLLTRLLDSSANVDAALASQIEAYRCDQYEKSIAHSDRLGTLVAESARLQRELLQALRQAESDQAGTLEQLGLSYVVPSSGID